MPSTLLLLFAISLGSRVEVQPLDANRHLLRIDMEARTGFAAAQAAIDLTATRLCADRTYFFGAFKFAEQSEAPGANSDAGRATFQQELHCSAPEQRTEGGAAEAAGPSEAWQQAVLKATYGYLAAKDGGRLSDAYAMLSRRAKLTSPEPDWRRRARDFNDHAGAVSARRVTEISWYSDPPDAPEPGLYVAADFNGVFENVEFLCGYVVWRLDADGSFRLVREEQNFVERRRSGGVAQLDRAPLRARMGCNDR